MSYKITFLPHNITVQAEAGQSPPKPEEISDEEYAAQVLSGELKK